MNTTSVNTAPNSTRESGTHSLYRPFRDRMIAGVGSGIARSLGLDPLIVRIALVVLVFVGGIGIPLYLACWLLMPEEGCEKSIAREFADTARDWRD
jgi:phage shock protein PspC (stress-responsive transcriptional regulator)